MMIVFAMNPHLSQLFTFVFWNHCHRNQFCVVKPERIHWSEQIYSIFIKQNINTYTIQSMYIWCLKYNDPQFITILCDTDMDLTKVTTKSVFFFSKIIFFSKFLFFHFVLNSTFSVQPYLLTLKVRHYKVTENSFTNE